MYISSCNVFLSPTQLMTLFMPSPAFLLAVDSIYVGFHAGTVSSPTDEANTRIRAAHAAGEVILRQRQGIFLWRTGDSHMYYTHYILHIAFIIRQITSNHIATIGKAKYHFLGLPSSHNPSARIRHSVYILDGINRTVRAIRPGNIITSSK